MRLLDQQENVENSSPCSILLLVYSMTLVINQTPWTKANYLTMKMLTINTFFFFVDFALILYLLRYYRIKNFI